MELNTLKTSQADNTLSPNTDPTQSQGSPNELKGDVSSTSNVKRQKGSKLKKYYHLARVFILNKNDSEVIFF